MLLYAMWLLTPTLGALRNYAKYHTFTPELFIRTPILNVALYAGYRWLSMDPGAAVLLSTVSERWVLLGYKMGVSVYRDDFNVKRAKYIRKGHIPAVN